MLPPNEVAFSRRRRASERSERQTVVKTLVAAVGRTSCDLHRPPLARGELPRARSLLPDTAPFADAVAA
jgi:hypothetical protein